MTLPNFLIIGGMRCATTTLQYVLDRHPQICMSSVKETNFFKSDAAPKGGLGGGLTSDLRRELTDRYFRSDILELQTLIGRDLSHWLR